MIHSLIRIISGLRTKISVNAIRTQAPKDGLDTRTRQDIDALIKKNTCKSETLNIAPVPNQPRIAELDELYTLLGKKKTKFTS